MTSPDDAQDSPSLGRAPRSARLTPGRIGRWARSRGCSDRGAVLVEAAFVFPVLIFFILGIVDFGNAFNNYISLRQGVREAAREAAITTRPPGPWSCSLTGLPYSEATTVPVHGVDIYEMMCYAKNRIGLNNDADVRISIAWNNPYSPSTVATAIDSVVICAQYKLSSISGLFSPFLNNRVITSKTEIRIEQPSANINAAEGATPPATDSAQETALSSWPTSCTTP